MKRKWLKRLILILLCIAAACTAAFFTINGVVRSSTSPYITQAGETPVLDGADCIIVPGSLVYSSGSLSAVVKDRMDRAIALYEAGAAPKLLISGDHGQTDYDEVNTMMDYAVSRGVPESDIFLDHAGFSTYETMVRAQEVFCVERAIIVTQQFHIYRSVYTARALGIDAVGVIADARTYANASYYENREKLARVKDFLYVHIFRPPPKYLGQQIPISGSSDATHDK